MTFLSLTEERLTARLRLIVLTIVECVELTMWYWEGGRFLLVCHYSSTVGKNSFNFVKGVRYRILGSESTFTFMSLNWKQEFLLKLAFTTHKL